MANFSIGCTCAASGNLGVTAAASVTAGAQSVDGNYTTVNYSYSASRTGWTFTGTSRPNAGALVLVINGTTCVNVALPLNNGSGNGTGLVSGSGSVRVYHNGDGTKAISVTFRIDKGSDPRGANYVWNGDSSTQSMTLNTIPRASYPSMSASAVTLGNSITINTNRKSTSFTHNLWWKCNSDWFSIATGVGDSYAWTTPRVIANYITSSTSGTVTILCRTYSGGNQIGSDQYTSFTANVPSDIVPSISNFSVWDANSNVSSKFGVYLKGSSYLGISFSDAGSYGSSIASRKITANNQTFWNNNSVTTDYLSWSGEMTVTVTTTDTRGRSASKQYKITVYDYGTPWVSSFKGIRCNSDGSVNDGGQYLKIQFAGGVYSVSSKNTAQYQLGYRQSGSGDYTWKILDLSALNYDLTTTGVISGLTFSVEHSYDLILWVGDKLGNEARRSDTLATEFRLMDFYQDGTGMAIGKVAESPNLFDVGLNSHFRKEMQVDGTIHPNTTSPTKKLSGLGKADNYMHIATLKINNNYINSPVEIEYIQRSSYTTTHLYILFNPADNTDPSLKTFRYSGWCRGAYIAKASTSTWNVYILKSEPWEDIGIVNIKKIDNYGITVTKVENVNVSSLPSGYVKAGEEHPYGVLDIGNSNNTTFAYSKDGMGFYDTSWLACWNGYELRAMARTALMDAWHDNSSEWSAFRFGNGLMIMKRLTQYTSEFSAWGSVYSFNCNYNADQIPDYPVAFTSTPSRFVSLADGSTVNILNATPAAEGINKRPLKNFGGWTAIRPTNINATYIFILTAIGWWK